MDGNGRDEQLLKCPVCGTEFPCLTAICPGCGHVVDSSGISPSAKAFIAEIEDYDKLIAETKVKNIRRRPMIVNSFCRTLWIMVNIFMLCMPWAAYLILALRRDGKMPELTAAEKRKGIIIQNFDFPSDKKTLMEILLYIKSKVAVLAQNKTDSRTVYWMRMWSARTEILYEKISGQLIWGKDIVRDAHISIVKNSRKIMCRVMGKALAGTVIIVIDFLAIMVSAPIMGGAFEENPLKEISGDENSVTENFEDDDSEKIFEGEIDKYGNLSIKNLTLWFPYYWYEEGSRSGYCQFFSERSGRMARLVIGYPVNTEDKVNPEVVYVDNEGIMEIIRTISGFDDCLIYKYQLIKSDYGVKGILYSYTFTMKIDDMKHKGNGKCFFFSSEADNRCFFIEMATTDNVERESYDEEYMKMIASIRVES